MVRELRYVLLHSLYALLYGRLAWAYDAVAYLVSHGQWRAWGAAALPFLVGTRVLELGHGPGHILVKLAGHGFEAVGLDLSPHMGHRASRHPPRPRLVRGRAQESPFAAGAFDSVLATFPAPYITAPQTATTVFQLLRPGGRLIIVPQARLLGGGVWQALIQLLYRAIGQDGDASGNGAAVRDFWEKALSGAGFGVTLHEVLLSESVVTVVVAERPDGA